MNEIAVDSQKIIVKIAWRLQASDLKNANCDPNF